MPKEQPATEPAAPEQPAGLKCAVTGKDVAPQENLANRIFDLEVPVGDTSSTVQVRAWMGNAPASSVISAEGLIKVLKDATAALEAKLAK